MSWWDVLTSLRFPIPENEVVFDDYNDLDGAGRIGLVHGEIYKYRTLAICSPSFLVLVRFELFCFFSFVFVVVVVAVAVVVFVVVVVVAVVSCFCKKKWRFVCCAKSGGV